MYYVLENLNIDARLMHDQSSGNLAFCVTFSITKVDILNLKHLVLFFGVSVQLF